jgi:Tol biopolymer transport system component
LIGTRVGPYEITAQLGVGGMGEVYRARDFHLGRDVALKVLPEGFTSDPERLARFEREAKLLAQLNHPNIAQIYGFEASGEARALVMELVEGPTLAERLEGGPLPFHESLSLSLQIAQALEEAHEKGIVHRDLKPQNIKASIEGRVKVLDFGLAKAMDPAGGATPSASQLAQSPTLTLGATVQGVILGTAAYMAPEQAKGLAVDKRADVWAFGVVLYEMLTGERLFAGDTVPETLAGVIRAEIDLSKLPADTPPAVRRLVERCLERDPKRRLRDIGEARVVLERPAELAAPAVAAGRASSATSRGALAAVALVAFGLGGSVVWIARKPSAAPATGAPMRVHLMPPKDSHFSVSEDPLMLSPDGSQIVFRLEEGTDDSLAVRSLDGFEVRKLPGTRGAYEPDWSPDGRSLLFFEESLSRIDASGLQPAQKLAPVTDARGASWGEDDTILFAPTPSGAIHRVSAAGGEAVKVTELDATRGEIAHVRPQWLPGGRHFLYLVRSERDEQNGLYVGSLDGKLKRRLLGIDVAVRFAPPDLVLAVHQARLVARRIDLAKLELSRDAWTLADAAEYNPLFDMPKVSTSRAGRLVYHPPSRLQVRQLVRIDREGRVLEKIGEPGDENLDLSPDGGRIASVRFDERRAGSIWIRDLRRSVASRLSQESRTIGPVWSPDGRSIAYAATSPSGLRLLVRPAAGGEARLVWEDPYLGEPIDWSPDGSMLLVEVGAVGLRTNLVLVPAGGGAPVPFAATAADEHSGRFSPDGRWIAYVSRELGRGQIFVEPYPKTGERYLVSPHSGESPRWAGNDEILYVEGERRSGRLMSVRVQMRGNEISFEPARSFGPTPGYDYEPAPGGRELYITESVSEFEALPPVLIENWTALLAPTGSR